MLVIVISWYKLCFLNTIASWRRLLKTFNIPTCFLHDQKIFSVCYNVDQKFHRLFCADSKLFAILYPSNNQHALKVYSCFILVLYEHVKKLVVLN